MNISNQKTWRAELIAISEVSKYDNNVQIIETSEFGNKFYDLLVDSTDKGIRYGLIIKRSDFKRTKIYEEYIEQLQLHKNEITVPILLVSVNESTEEVNLGIVFSWFHKRPLVTQNVVLWKSSEESWNKALNLIAMSAQIDSPVQFLQLDNLYVKKTISLCVHSKDKRRILSELVYLRKLSHDYHMTPKERKTQQEELQFFMQGYDKNEYPSDSLDNAIYSAVNAKFNDITIKNELVVLNTELRDLQLYREYHRGQVLVKIEPYLDDMSEAAIRLLSGSFTELHVKVELYSNTDTDRDYFNNLDFTYQEQVDGWVGKVIEYKKELGTYYLLSDIIG